MTQTPIRLASTNGCLVSRGCPIRLLQYAYMYSSTASTTIILALLCNSVHMKLLWTSIYLGENPQIRKQSE